MPRRRSVEHDGRPPVPPLVARLDDAHPHVVAWSAEALGRIGDRAADETPRIYAAQALEAVASRVGRSRRRKAEREAGFAWEAGGIQWPLRPTGILASWDLRGPSPW